MQFEPSSYSGGWIPDWVPVIGTKEKFQEATGVEVDLPGEGSLQEVPPSQEEPDLPDVKPPMSWAQKAALLGGAVLLVGGTIYFWPRR